MNTQFEHWFRRHSPNIAIPAALEVLKLSAQGQSASYIAYYQSDAIGGLNLNQVFEILDAEQEWKEINHRQLHIVQEITAQNRITDELKETILQTHDLDRLEDLYIPFKLKRQTLGVQAKESGLGKLADYIWALGHGQAAAEEIAGDTIEDKAKNFVQEGSKFSTPEAVIKGVSDILVEQIAENSALRSLVRGTVIRRSKIKSAKGTKAKQNSKYSKFFAYQEPVGSLKKASAGFRYLMIRKGWMEDELTLSFERPDEGILLEKFEEFACTNKESIGADILLKAARLALKGNVYTVMENEAHRYLKEHAEKHVVQILSEAFFKKLLRAPLGRKAVLGVDSGTEPNTAVLVLIDDNGKYVIHSQISTTETNETITADILKMLENAKVQAVSLAHGPKSKELREFFRKLLAGKNISIVNLHEHSASIYASSGASKEEFPEFDLAVKRCIFVARYLQDPLQAMLRLDSKYIFLNEIQHEVSPAQLRTGLFRAMEAAVARVGLDINHVQSPHVLAKTPGLNLEIAKKILEAREKNTAFTSLSALQNILGPERFEYVVPFLRIEGSTLDATGIHPRHYAVVQDWVKAKGYTLTALTDAQLEEFKTDETLKTSVGATTLEFIAQDLKHFGHDPRGHFEPTVFATDLNTLADLKKDNEYPGIVTNVTAFGAFVDLGLEQDGLVHITELSDLHRNPVETLSPGDRVSVWVLGVNEEKKQISLSMNSPQDRAQAANARARSNPRARREGAEKAEKRPRRAPAPRPIPGDGPKLNTVEAGAAEAAERRAAGHDRNRGHAGASTGGRERFDRKFNGPRREEPKVELDPKAIELAAIKAKKKLPRDPKTGAIVKLDDMLSSRGGAAGGGRGGPRGGPRAPREDGPRVASKAQPHTFNPFANLGNLLKDKVKN